MPSIDRMVRTEIRKLARQGRLIDETFKVFQRAVYPGAPPEQVAMMRFCFFAGVAEFYAITMASLDDGLAETDGDRRFMAQWVGEIEVFHAHILAAASAADRRKPQ